MVWRTLSENIYPLFGFLLMAVTVILYGKSEISRSRAVLQQWAAVEGLEIVKSRYRNLFCGPFTWNSRRG
jgi:hypothetical protein